MAAVPGGFHSALLELGVNVQAATDVPLDVQERAELMWLRNRVHMLEAQLRITGIMPVKDSQPPVKAWEEKGAILKVPVGTLNTVEAKLHYFLLHYGLSQYEDTFAEHGYCDMSTVAHMQESHMKAIGMTPGHALKLWQKIQEYTFGQQMVDLDRVDFPSPPAPGIYRCVHGPRVAIRDAPSKNGKILETLKPGDIIRISQIVPPCWGKVDESELWARFTTVFPRKPRVLKQLGADGQLLEDEDVDEEEESPYPTEAFVLIEGKEVGIDGSLLRRISVQEAKEVRWPFRDALDVRCAEMDAASLRRQPRMGETLRQRFVSIAKSYVGTPYAKSFHTPGDPRYLAGSEKIDAPLFLDNKQLVVKVVEDLMDAFGFKLDMNVSCAHLHDLLAQYELQNEGQLEPGDLIFYEVASKSGRSRRTRIVHVEICIGDLDAPTLLTVGSLPWDAGDRTGGKDGVQIFPGADMDYWEGEEIEGTRYCSIRPWLTSDECSFAHGQLMRQQGKSLVVVH